MSNISNSIARAFADKNGRELNYKTQAALENKLNAIPDAVAGVSALYQKTAENAKFHAPDVAAVLEAVDSIADYYEDSRELKKGLRVFLSEKCGFSASKVTKITAATSFTNKLAGEASDASRWVKSLPYEHQYILSNMSPAGFAQAWATLSKWGSQDVTQKDLRQLQNKHPKTAGERRGTWTRPNGGVAESQQSVSTESSEQVFSSTKSFVVPTAVVVEVTSSSDFPTPTLSSAAVLPPSSSNNSVGVALQLKELYQQIEAIVLPNRRAIQEDPEARKYLQWITDLNRSYFRID
jgi:hypothetical protein